MRERTAYHEAAHAVAQKRAGIDIGNLTIIPDPAGNILGLCQSGAWWTQEELEGEVIALLAGAAAEVELKEVPIAEAEVGAGADIEQARDLINRFELGTIGEWMDRARSFVRAEGAVIAFLATVLLDLEAMDPCEVDCAFDEFEEGRSAEESIALAREGRRNQEFLSGR